jgi:hypothetical protein
MRRITIMTGCLLLVVAGVALASASDESTPEVPSDGLASLKQRTEALRLVLDEQRVQRAALEKEYRMASDEATALDVQRRMEDLARTTEWRILGIQAAYLREAGRIDEAKALEEAVQRMREPRAEREPVARPRADSSGRAR